jgi:hypothetical protein
MRYSDSGNGIAADSLDFYRQHRHQLGSITSAQLRFPGFDDPHDPYLMVVRDEAGNEIALSGCTTGYHGEGPRAAIRLLVEEGWAPIVANRVLTAATLSLTRNAAVHARNPTRSRSAAPRPSPVTPVPRPLSRRRRQHPA